MKVSRKNPTKKAVKRTQKSKRIPLTELVCILSGKTERVNYAKLTKLTVKFKFETVEEYIKYYICNDCIKLLRQGHTEKQIQQQFNYESDVKITFNVLKHYVKTFKNRQKIEKIEKRKEVLKYIENKAGAYIVKPRSAQYIDMTDEKQVSELTKSSCVRPDIFLNNDRSCNNCHLYEHCKCKLRTWRDVSEGRTKRKR
jgi:hypothetical protein